MTRQIIRVFRSPSELLEYLISIGYNPTKHDPHSDIVTQAGYLAQFLNATMRIIELLPGGETNEKVLVGGYNQLYIFRNQNQFVTSDA